MSTAADRLADLEEERLEKQVLHLRALNKRLTLADISAFIRRSMKAKRFTHVQLANESGLGEQTIFRIVHGKDFRLTTLLDLVDALGYEVDIQFKEKKVI